MEHYPNQQGVSRLIPFLESLLTSTHQSKVEIEAHSSEAQRLLQGWVLPENDSSDISCRCVESQRKQLNAFLEKVERAVKYSQCIREGQSDVVSPWPEDIGNSTHKVGEKKVNSPKKNPAVNCGVGLNKDKNKGKVGNGPSKRSISAIQSPLPKPVEDQQQHNSLCPLHGISDDSQRLRKIQTVGLAEALDVKGIPPELVTILKSVHQYINRLRTTNLKNRAETSFLRHLNSVNESRWEKFRSSELMRNLSTYSPKGASGKIYIFEDDEEEGEDEKRNNWQFDGIWNPAICNIMSVGAFCVQYQSKEIWKLLQMKMQQLQLSHAEWQVCDILSCEPLLCNPDMHYSTASLFVKAATALSKLTALNLPVLVKPFREH